MRIAVINSRNRRAGGAEIYLQQIVPGLREQGHQIAFVYEIDGPADREPIAISDPALTWGTALSGVAEVLRQLAGWRPDVLFVHGLTQHDWLLEIVQSIPSVFFCHDYAGICISGTKTFRALEARSCGRPFGWQCLAHYYPCRCGGLSPITMWRDYGRQSERLKLMRLGKAIVTASSAVRQEYLRNGFAPERVHLAPLMPNCELAPSLTAHPVAQEPWRLLFAGRMEWLKGGDIFLDALPLVSTALDRPLHVTFSGDGTCRAAWEQKAALLQAERLRIGFNGWQDAAALQAIFDQTHLLVFPSIWPEPFGLVGLEAGCRGVPVAAFRKGGIPDWLQDGVNGFLAPANPPRAEGLAEAIGKCLADPETYQRLRSGAAQMVPRFTLARHLQALNDIFAGVLKKKAA